MTDQQLIQNFTLLLIQAALSFGIAMALTPIYTFYAFRLKLWKQIRTSTTTGEKAKVFASLHARKHKRNIPTMAGVIMVLAIAIVTVTTNLSKSQTYLPIFSLIAAGIVGLVDDIINVKGHGKGVAGLRTPVKLMLITAVAILGALYFFFWLGYSSIHIPAVGSFDIGLAYIPLFILVIVSTSNAVNITDGLDGLSGGLLATAFSAFAIIALTQGNIGIAGFCMAAVGAVLAYTWFNIFPARFFMGDVGSFAMGTALGVVAMLTNSVFVLPIIGFVFVLEAGSSVLQILSKKLFHRKIFISAPFHHHLEAIGWPETKITMRLWVIGAACAGLGIIISTVGRG